MAFEALNHAGSLDADLLVILNDNDMSISENVGRAVELPRARCSPAGSTPASREGGKKVAAQHAAAVGARRAAPRST